MLLIGRNFDFNRPKTKFNFKNLEILTLDGKESQNGSFLLSSNF